MTGGVSPLAGIAAAPQQSAERAKMQAVATQFEAVFLRQMIGSMRTAGAAEGMFDSSASQQFRDMADSRTADSMAQTGAIGVAQMLMRQYDAQHPAEAKSVTSPAVDSGR
ncbi:MAG: rod-binding protein [Sphingomonas sp.]